MDFDTALYKEHLATSTVTHIVCVCVCVERFWHVLPTVGGGYVCVCVDPSDAFLYHL